MITHLTVNELDSKIQSFADISLGEKVTFLRSHILMDPTLQLEKFDTEFTNPSNFKLKEKIMLALVHWYFPDEIKFLINLWLEKHWGTERKEVKVILLTSKRSALGWLFIQEDFNNFDFFGNYLKKETFRAFSKIKFRRIYKPKGVKRYSGWCRGPKDQGSMNDNINSRTKIRDGHEFVAQVLLEEVELNNQIELLFNQIDDFYRLAG